MRNTRKNNIQLGMFVGIGALIFILAIYYIGNQSNIFGRNFTISGVFNDISGLKVGNDVRFSGINIGTVSKVEIINDSLVRVDLSVQNDVRKFIRKDSKMEIGSEGLMGNKIVNIYSGSSHEQIVESGDYLETIEVVNIDNILKQINTSSQNTTRITENIAEITDKINRGEGIFGKIFADEDFSKNLSSIAKNTANLTKNFASITEKINQEKGTIGLLLSDTTLAKEVEKAGINLKTSTDNLVTITDQVKKGQGLFGEIFTDTTFTSSLSKSGKNLAYTTERTKTITDNLEKLTLQVNEGQGLISKLLFDTAFADSVQITVSSINKSAEEIEEAAGVIKRNWLLRLFSKKEKKK
ncbi:MAG: MlaD family protein [Bacteroidales bacterium]|jgi:phospholipid/cholesterol/gamma-HCH transport system substrate-binding protein|nr:MlaD family protein [Bacteroidales bacterium]